MERAFRQTAVVGPNGRVELSASDLVPGTRVEAILLVADDVEEREDLVRAILAGERDVAAGRTRQASDFFGEHADRYALPG